MHMAAKRYLSLNWRANRQYVIASQPIIVRVTVFYTDLNVICNWSTKLSQEPLREEEHAVLHICCCVFRKETF